ncbi:hypothetical protein M1O57_04705 [Dehalococcoidia bacterium]|nr:hypothetical protein [Dehalococcoidia bacterium]
MRFLGFEIRLVRSRRSGKKFALMYPSKKAMKGLYDEDKSDSQPPNASGDRGGDSEAEQVIEGVGELLSDRTCLEMVQ